MATLLPFLLPIHHPHPSLLFFEELLSLCNVELVSGWLKLRLHGPFHSIQSLRFSPFTHSPNLATSTGLTTMAALEEARLREAIDYMKEADKKYAL